MLLYLSGAYFRVVTSCLEFHKKMNLCLSRKYLVPNTGDSTRTYVFMTNETISAVVRCAHTPIKCGYWRHTRENE